MSPLYFYVPCRTIFALRSRKVVPCRTVSVVLRECRPMFRQAVRLSRQAGLVWSLLHEAAWHDDRRGKYGQRECGGTTCLSHEAIADQCWIGKAQVIKAIDQLLDDGLIACMWLEPKEEGRGRWKRRYRVFHSDVVEAQRQAISVMGTLPSERAKRIRERKEAPRPEEVIADVFDDCGRGDDQGWEDEMFERAHGVLR